MDRLGTTRTTNPGRRNEIRQGYYNQTDAVSQFKTAILDSIGTAPDSIIADGSLHRFKIDGKLNGAYVLYLDGRAAGYFEDFKQGIKQTWKLAGDFQPLTELQRQAFKVQSQLEAQQRQTEEAAKHKEAASKAIYIWHNATPAPVNHPYLIKKRIKPHGARSGRDNSLIIPLYNASRELTNLQFIQSDGTKRFLSGGIKKGCFYWLGEEITDKILICEGVATGASLFESSGLLTVVAFDAGNLKEAAINIKGICPKSEIVICGDNDESGVGQKAAIEAALAIGCKYIIPATLGHDWNDSLNAEVM